MARMPLSRAVEVLVGNPFDTDPDELAAAEAALDRLELTAELSRLATRDAPVEAKRLLLAAGHVEARRTPHTPSEVLSETRVPNRALRGLPRTRGAYRRIVMAAGRCHAALAAIAGESSAMARLRSETWAACFGRSLHHALALESVITDHDVLFLGETGTGKELFAHAILEGTPGGPDGRPAPCAAVNAAAMPEGMIESELFGHEKGAFTGAVTRRAGRIRTAADGAFFLDECGDLPLATQVKLLRIMEDNVVVRVGADEGEEIDLRWVAATHKDLPAMVEEGTFRRDLYQRLAGHVIHIPPLRERLEDVPVIAARFVATYSEIAELPEVQTEVDQFLDRALDRGYPWPGNVRELQNVLRSLMLGVEPALGGGPATSTPSREPLPAIIANCGASMAEVERWYLGRVLEKVEGNFSQAARILELDRATVRRRARARRKGAS